MADRFLDFLNGKSYIPIPLQFFIGESFVSAEMVLPTLVPKVLYIRLINFGGPENPILNLRIVFAKFGTRRRIDLIILPGSSVFPSSL